MGDGWEWGVGEEEERCKSRRRVSNVYLVGMHNSLFITIFIVALPHLVCVFLLCVCEQLLSICVSAAARHVTLHSSLYMAVSS